MKSARILLVLGVVLFTVSAARSDSGTMSVQVKEGQLRSAPSFLGPVRGTGGLWRQGGDLAAAG